MRKMVIPFLLAGIAGTATAQPASPPDDAQAQEELVPEVIIREREPGVIEEYRVGGELYMIKVTPAKGPPYYLVDANGDNMVDDRLDDLTPDLLIPSWVLYRFD